LLPADKVIFDDILKSHGLPVGSAPLSHVEAISTILSAKHCMMVFGKNSAKKSELIAAVAAKYHTVTVDVAANDSDALYGTKESKNGIFTDLLRSCISGELSKKEGQKLIIFSGPVNCYWAENLNSLCDDNRFMNTAWDEKLHLPSDVKIMVDTDSCAVASPATVSRLIPVYFDEA